MKRRKSQSNNQTDSKRRLCIAYRDHVIRTVALPAPEADEIVSADGDGIMLPPSNAVTSDFFESVPLDRIVAHSSSGILIGNGDDARENKNKSESPSANAIFDDGDESFSITQPKIVVRRLSEEEIADIIENGAALTITQPKMVVQRLSEEEIAELIDAHGSSLQININRIDDSISSDNESLPGKIQQQIVEHASDNSAHSEIDMPTSEEACENENNNVSEGAINESNGGRRLSASDSAYSASSQSNNDMLSSTLLSGDSDATKVSNESQTSEISSLSPSNVSDYASDDASDDSARSENDTPTNNDACDDENKNESSLSSTIFGDAENSQSNVTLSSTVRSGDPNVIRLPD